mgnify:CR=1 FL=1
MRVVKSRRKLNVIMTSTDSRKFHFQREEPTLIQFSLLLQSTERCARSYCYAARFLAHLRSIVYLCCSFEKKKKNFQKPLRIFFCSKAKKSALKIPNQQFSKDVFIYLFIFLQIKSLIFVGRLIKKAASKKCG